MEGVKLVSERKYDNNLNIRTTGLREWNHGVDNYNRYEATPYEALDELFKHYKLRKTDKVVDFGVGRGRVAFYIHNRFKVSVTGIEANDKTLDEAIRNKESYEYKLGKNNLPIHFEYGLAEHYKIKPDENVFYFFNPFSAEVFKEAVNNILKSLEENKRTMDIILYYPMPRYKKFLKDDTPFELLNKVRLPGVSDKREKFLIYRYRDTD